MVDAVDLSSIFNEKWCEEVNKMTKWSERKDCLEKLSERLS